MLAWLLPLRWALGKITEAQRYIGLWLYWYVVPSKRVGIVIIGHLLVTRVAEVIVKNIYGPMHRPT